MITPSLGIIQAQIRAIRSKAPDARTFGLFTTGRWTGPAIQASGNEQIAVYQCDSPLQMRLAMQEAPAEASAVVLLTPLDQSQISDDLLVRLALRRLHTLNSWEIVRVLFRAQQLDPRLTRHAFLADLLLEHAAGRDFLPVAGGLLDADTVWSLLLEERLALPGARPDLVEILRGTAESGLAGRWTAGSEDFRRAAAEWLLETAGPAAALVLDCLKTEYGSQALAIGLVLGVIFHDAAGREMDKAAGRLETYLGTTNPPLESIKRWRNVASTALGRLSREAARRCLDEADALLVGVQASDWAWRSSDLKSGFEQRCTRFGKALAASVEARATRVSDELKQACAALRQHRMWPDSGRRKDRVEMAIRLARRLADLPGPQAEMPKGLAPLARDYAAHGGFMDWARQVLRGGEPNQEMESAFVNLVDRLTARREEENRHFGQALKEQQAQGNPEGGLIPVEQVLDRVVAEIAGQAPVLVLLIDGLSWAVFRELAVDIRHHDWIELGLGPAPNRLIGLAALPSLTSVCRTSLFCGTLRLGQAQDEIQGFSTHPGLLAQSQSGFPPRLFHKATLEGADDSSLSLEIRQTLQNKKQRVVGIVINAVDDNLDKGDQIDAVWTLQHIRVLEPILAEAAGAGRMVILLGDHGHVLDRQMKCRPEGEGNRWRSPQGQMTEEEMEIRSPRVLLPEGGRVVVPWSERLRYGPPKNGYHGGATPQEMLIPLSLWWHELEIPDGFGELSDEWPVWWTESESCQPAPVVAKPVKHPPKKAAALLLDLLPAEPPDAEDPWIKALLGSTLFIDQRKRFAGRTPIEDATLRKLLAALARRGGSMTAAALAGAIELPEHRLPGLLAVIQRVLNVEGYPILDRQEAAQTVVLNVPLLKKQFDLGQ